LYQVLGVCFNPYNAFFSKNTLFFPTNNKTLRLHYIDLFFQVPILKGWLYIKLIKQPTLMSCKCNEYFNSIQTSYQSKIFIEINFMQLRITLSYQSYLVLLHRTILIVLHLINLFHTNHFFVFFLINQHPSFILNHIYSLLHSYSPMFLLVYFFKILWFNNIKLAHYIHLM
jgi:hypothetical protein